NLTIDEPSPNFHLLLSPQSKTEEEALSRLNLGLFWQWILCFCVVHFDLEKGQSMEAIYPPIEFSEQELKTICFSAFPDSNSIEHNGDSVFSFRMRNGYFSNRLYLQQKANNLDPSRFEDMIPGLPIQTDGYTYGYVFFRQKKDEELKRGFFQKSLVILSPHPWPGLFLQMVRILGPELMESLVKERKTQQTVGTALLEAASFNVASWPSLPSSLFPGSNFTISKVALAFLGAVEHFLIPPEPQFPQMFDHQRTRQYSGSSMHHKYNLCNPGLFYQVFVRSLENMWISWELLVLGEPLLVSGDSPTACSTIVWALVELIKPLPFGGDFRPYFTIQDSDSKGLTSKARPPAPGTILGVTNRVFDDLLEHWPHSIDCGRTPEQFGSVELAGTPLAISHSVSQTSSISGIRTKHRPYLSKDKKLLKDIQDKGVKVQGEDGVNNMIRRHFVELTERFLQPLNRYFDSLVIGNPNQMTFSALRTKPEVKPFKQEDFMRQIEQFPPILPVKPKRPLQEMYQQFIKSVNFASWLQTRTRNVYREWRHQYLNTLAFGPLEQWYTQKLDAQQEIECIDIAMRLKHELEQYAPYFVWDNQTIKWA
ncbi:hypothetical protein EDD86DRAFT_178966, partial [Gorgonomyces haynaldii]